MVLVAILFYFLFSAYSAHALELPQETGFEPLVALSLMTELHRLEVLFLPGKQWMTRQWKATGFTLALMQVIILFTETSEM